MNSANTEKETDSAETATAEVPAAEAVLEPNGEAVLNPMVDAMNAECRREVSVEIPADVASKTWENLVKRYSRLARVPGFRKGKVPATVIRKRYAEEIKTDIIESLVPQYFRAVVEKEGLRPMSQPIVRELEMEEGQAIRFKAAFEVLPKIELGPYNDIRVERTAVNITDEDVAGELARLQERQGSYDPVDEDRALVKGDFAQVSFEAIPKEAAAENADEAAKAAAKPQQPIHMDEVLVEIGGANTVNEFNENLLGAKPGEEKAFDVVYADDFYDARLAGKTLHYKVKINAIKMKSMPELNDDFAKELSPDFPTLDALKKRIHEGMEAEMKHKAEHEAKEKLVAQLVEQNSFPVPNALVERQVDIRLERGLRALASQGMSTEDMRKMDFRRLRVAQRSDAEKEVRANLLLAEIANAEHIEVSKEEFEQEIEIMARQLNQTVEAVKQKLAEDGAAERIHNRMRTDKALDLLLSQSA